MRQLLKNGGVLTTVGGSTAEIVRLIGAGTQGEVYEVKIDGRQAALKWWKKRGVSTPQCRSVSKLCLVDPPSGKFVWPLEMVKNAKEMFAGYVMELVDLKAYCAVGARLLQKVPTTGDAIICSCYNLTRAFTQLHSRGLVYCDLNHDNLLWNPATGGILLLDPDNITVRGSDVAIDGTYGPMAPELVRQEKRPSIATDLHSLAVIIFTMLMGGHPLEGAQAAKINCRDEAALVLLHGRRPIFVYDPQDASNRPIPGRHDPILFNWPRYPKFLQDLFVRAFTVGLTNPSHGRVRETEWVKALRRLRDLLIYCESCGCENYLESKASEPEAVCCHCSKQLRDPLSLNLNGRRWMSLSVGKKLYGHDRTISPDELLLAEPWAEVVAHPRKVGSLGLKNLSKQVWQACGVNGSKVTVRPEHHLVLGNGSQFQAGSLQGTVKQQSTTFREKGTLHVCKS